jgi:hypothetical protein
MPKLFEPFEKNSHGHYILEVAGAGLTGAEEFKLLQKRKCEFGEQVETCLTQCDFDNKHQLAATDKLKLALVPHALIARDEDRTPRALVELGKSFGYTRPRAGVVPRVWERLTHRTLSPRGIGFYYIVPQHEPLKDINRGRSLQMYISSYPNERVAASILTHSPPATWNDRGASAFVMPPVAI